MSEFIIAAAFIKESSKSRDLSLQQPSALYPFYILMYFDDQFSWGMQPNVPKTDCNHLTNLSGKPCVAVTLSAS